MKDKPAHSKNVVPDWPERLTITNPEAAVLLTNLREAVFLKPFHTVQGCTIGQAAERFGLTPNATYRRVKKLERLGILEVVAQDTRRGKPLRHYRARARMFFIPDHLYPLAEWVRVGLKEQLEVFHENLARAVQEGPQPVRGLVSGELDSPLRVAFAGEGGTDWNPRAPEVPVTKWAFRTLRLDYGRARQLVDELREVAQRYYGDTGPDLYLLGQFVTPVAESGHLDPDLALPVD